MTARNGRPGWPHPQPRVRPGGLVARARTLVEGGGHTTALRAAEASGRELSTGWPRRGAVGSIRGMSGPRVS